MPKTTYVWDELSDNVIEEYEDGVLSVSYTHEPGLYGNLLSQNRNGITSYYHYDGRGDTVALTDDADNVTDTKEYDAWGNVIASTGGTVTLYQFGGRKGYQTGNTGIYVRARLYQPTEARWSSVDPLKFQDGMNPFMYAGLNSLSSGSTFFFPAGVTIGTESAFSNTRAYASPCYDAESCSLSQNGRLSSFDRGISLRKESVAAFMPPWRWPNVVVWPVATPVSLCQTISVAPGPTANTRCGGSRGQRKFSLMSPSDKPLQGVYGSIVQQIHREYNVRNCDGTPHEVDSSTFFEAWPVEAGAVAGGFKGVDDFSTPNYGENTKGSITLSGSAGFILGYTAGPPKWKLPGDRGHQRPAVDLPTLDALYLPGFNPSVNVSVTVTWDCCDCDPNRWTTTQVRAKGFHDVCSGVLQ